MFIRKAERKNAYKDLDLFKSSAYKVCTFRAPTENIGFRFLGKNFAKKALAWHNLLKTVNLKKCFFFFLIKEKKKKNNIGLVPSFLRQENNIIFYFEQSMFFFLFILERQKER